MSNSANDNGEPQGRVTVVGAGAWGTTLAHLIASAGRPTTLVTHTREQAQQIGHDRVNTRYLPSVTINERVSVTHEIEAAVRDAEVIALVVPSQQMRVVATSVVNSMRPDGLIVSLAKGIELGSLLRMSEVIVESTGIAPDRVCALSGPNLAREIAEGLPASAVVASVGLSSAVTVQRALSAPTFRLYTSQDVVGVELGGALKNVIALGAGVADGLGLGQNAKASFMTRGLAEMIRLGVAAGANPLTFGGLSGLGDLIATCESPLSRNRTFGERLGRGMSVADASGGTPHVVEGLTTARGALALAGRYGVEMPIASVVVAVLDGAMTVRQAIDALMSRGARPELDAPL
jgi:glycerol-3-phosphate dehydrogenase (NAD(P)+)